LFHGVFRQRRMGLSYATVTVMSKGAKFGIDCGQSGEEKGLYEKTHETKVKDA